MSTRHGSIAILQGIAVIENARRPLGPDKPKTYYLDAHFYMGDEQPQLSVLLRYFDDQLLTFEDFQRYIVHAKVIQPDETIDPHAEGRAIADYALVRDITQIVRASEQADVMHRPTLTIAGTALQPDKTSGAFNLQVQQITSILGTDKQGSLAAHAIFGDSARWNTRKPIPTPGSIVFVYGFLSSASRKDEKNLATTLEIELDQIAFLGMNPVANPTTNTENSPPPTPGSFKFAFPKASQASPSRPSKRTRTAKNLQGED